MRRFHAGARYRELIAPDDLASVAARFWQCVTKSDGCWAWRETGRRRYPNFGLPNPPRSVGAHRVAYYLTHGAIPEGMFVCHSCDNTRCVNPAHLFVGTHEDNMRDMRQKGRGRGAHSGRTHCKRGHAFDEGNTLYDRKGRRCRACVLQGSRASKERLRARQGRTKYDPTTHCMRGHEYTSENNWIVGSARRRRCRICAAIWTAARYAREKEQRQTARMERVA